MAKFSHKVMGKEVGQASVYAAPHKDGKAGADTGNNGYPNNIANTQTERTRGTTHTTRGNSHSKKMG
tara:strand:+ start:234 stop:434 length:201 start_codon:yes stop_codon:yes gene_type:complete